MCSSFCTSKELKLHVQNVHVHENVENEKDHDKTDIVEVSNFKNECDKCTYMTNCKFDLKRHILKKHSSEHEAVKEAHPAEEKTCPYCFKMFFNRSRVRHHIKTMHDQSLRLKCETCNKTFASKTSLEYHNKSHVPKTESACEEKDISIEDISNVPILPKSSVKDCHLCKQVIHSGHFRRHLEEVHGKTKINTDMTEVSAYPHLCDQCTFSTKRKYDLKRHKMQKHSECNVSFPCEQCGKGFKNESSLRRHNIFCKTTE